MNSNTNKPTYLQRVYLDIAALLEDYKEELPTREFGQALQEDLYILFQDKIKGSFKNGIQAGMKRRGQEQGKGSRLAQSINQSG